MSQHYCSTRPYGVAEGKKSILSTNAFLQCREIGYEIHEEVLKVLHELHTAMKTHQTYQSEFRQAENKLQIVEKQRNKVSQSIGNLIIQSTEFPIPSFVIFRHVLFWEFPCRAWAVASCSSGPQAGGTH